MSTSYFVHLGPYIRIKNILVDESRTKQCCINPECSRYHKENGGGKFCDSCGWAGTNNVEYMVKVPNFNQYKLLADYENSFWEPAYVGASDGRENSLKAKFHYLFPNQHGPRGRWALEPRSDAVEIDLKTLDWQKEVDWLESKFVAEMKIMRDAVGADNLEVCWGLITYAH